MSLVKIQGNASGSGIFTVAAPNSNTDRTLTLPDSTGTIATAESTLSQFNASGSAPVYACRAWVNFNGTSTVAIRASGNVSSITDNGTGDYTVNFTNAMVDANYAPQGTKSNQVSVLDSHVEWVAASSTAAAARFRTIENNAYVDVAYISIAVFR